jgi:hypothetical protein
MKRLTKKTGLVLAAVGGTLLCIFVLPTHIEGNWQTTTIGCMCDSHHFLRCEDGKVLSMSEYHPPPMWIGTYEQTGWGEYTVHLFLGAGSGVVRPKLLFLDRSGPLKTTWRDFAFWKTSHVLQDPAQEWVNDLGTWNIAVRDVRGQIHYFFGDREVGLEKAEQILARLKREVLTNSTPFVVYAGQEGIPMALRNILEKLNVEHEERPNQLLHRTQ